MILKAWEATHLQAQLNRKSLFTNKYQESLMPHICYMEVHSPSPLDLLDFRTSTNAVLNKATKDGNAAFSAKKKGRAQGRFHYWQTVNFL